jgi:hypothetical protein
VSAAAAQKHEATGGREEELCEADVEIRVFEVAVTV